MMLVNHIVHYYLGFPIIFASLVALSLFFSQLLCFEPLPDSDTKIICLVHSSTQCCVAI
jgi:hypothetical protein